MLEVTTIRERVRQSVADLGGIPLQTVDGDTPLIGPEAVLKSRELVEVLLDLEEFAEESLRVEFDWTSDVAMSPSQSVFQTVDSLARYLFRLQR